MAYGCLSASLLAVGTVAGGVWVLKLTENDYTLTTLLEHDEEVRDVDWSKDNSLLLSCSINGCVCLTNVERTHVYRKWIANTRTTCCKFHPLNQNMVVVGGGGSIYVFNCSTGAQVQCMTPIPTATTYITSMVCSGSYVFLGDSVGTLRVFKMKFSNNLLQLLPVGNSLPHPVATAAAISGMDIRAYSNICRGQVAVVSYEDATLGVYKISIAANPKVERFSCLVMAPTDRRVKPVWCPATDLDQPEHLAIGGEHANVHIYNLVPHGPPTLVNALSAHEAPVMTVGWSFDGQRFISGDADGTLISWKQHQSTRAASREPAACVSMSATNQGVTTSGEFEVSGHEEYSFTFSEASLATAGNSFFVEPSPREGDAPTEGVKIALKFLLTNVAAGIVIGKAGTNITLLQEASGARIQLSRNNVFYPGTAERVLLLTGSVRSVLLALYLILVKLTGRTKWQAAKMGEPSGSPTEEPTAEIDVEAETTQVKIVMPAAVCGAIIGRGGETVRGFAEDSGASISVSPQERSTRPDRMGPATDRIVTVTGGVQQILRAVALVVTTVAEDPNYVRNVGLSVNYAPRPSVGTPSALMMNSPQGGLAARAPFAPATTPTPSSGSFTQSSFPQDPAALFAQPPANSLQRTSPSHPGRVETKLSVPNEHVGAIIGKGGEILAQLQDLVGVKVTISGRGEFEPGTRNRVVSITGPPDAVNIGQLLITQKVHERIEQLQRQGSI